MIEYGELSLLPNGWAWTNLDAITKNLDGKRVPVNDKDRQKMKGTFPYYGASGIIDYVNNYLFDGEFLLIGEDGANLLSRSTPIAFLAKGKFWVNNHAHILSTYGDIPLQYLALYINSISLAQWVTGTAQPKLNQARMKTIPVPLAPLQEQKRIVGKVEELFSFLDAGVASLRVVQAQLKRYRQSVLKAAFEGKLTEQWRKNQSKESASSLIQSIVQERLKSSKFENSPNKSELFLIPENWAWSTIGNLFDVGSGGTPSRKEPEYWNGKIPWVSSGEVAFCEINKTKEGITSKGLEYSSAKLYPEGTVLMALYGEGKTRGQPAILRIKATTNQAIACIVCPKTPISSEYVYWWLYYRYYETRRIKSGANQPNMYLADVKQMPIVIAPLLEQQEIIREIQKKFSECSHVETFFNNNLELAEMRLSILKLAFEGKLVLQNSQDESAEHLLAKIKAERLGKSKENQLELSHYVK